MVSQNPVQDLPEFSLTVIDPVFFFDPCYQSPFVTKLVLPPAQVVLVAGYLVEGDPRGAAAPLVDGLKIAEDPVEVSRGQGGSLKALR